MKTDNELIAEFMGFRFHEVVGMDYSDCGGVYERTNVYSKVPIPIDKYEEESYLKEEWHPEEGMVICGNLHYDKSWDELMPVVEMIESLGHYVEIKRTQCSIYSSRYDGKLPVSLRTKIQAVYKSVVEFIKWHNENIEKLDRKS